MEDIIKNAKPVDVQALQDKIQQLHQACAIQRDLLVKIDASYAVFEAAGKNFYAISEEVMSEVNANLYWDKGISQSLESLRHIRNQGVLACHFQFEREANRCEQTNPGDVAFYRRASRELMSMTTEKPITTTESI